MQALPRSFKNVSIRSEISSISRVEITFTIFVISFCCQLNASGLTSRIRLVTGGLGRHGHEVYHPTCFAENCPLTLTGNEAASSAAVSFFLPPPCEVLFDACYSAQCSLWKAASPWTNFSRHGESRCQRESSLIFLDELPLCTKLVGSLLKF